LIRPVTEGPDRGLVRGLFEEYSTSLGLSLESQNFARELEDLPGKYGPPSGCLLLATEAGGPAGCVALRDLGEAVCEMKRLYVRHLFRGTGLGRSLMDRILEAGKALGYGRMRLDTIPSRMSVAAALYRTVGFQAIPAYWENPLPGVEYLELKL
jgi:GNAT superfamily N-acetyltransferase